MMFLLSSFYLQYRSPDYALIRRKVSTSSVKIGKTKTIIIFTLSFSHYPSLRIKSGFKALSRSPQISSHKKIPFINAITTKLHPSMFFSSGSKTQKAAPSLVPQFFCVTHYQIISICELEFISFIRYRKNN